MTSPSVVAIELVPIESAVESMPSAFELGRRYFALETIALQHPAVDLAIVSLAVVAAAVVVRIHAEDIVLVLEWAPAVPTAGVEHWIAVVVGNAIEPAVLVAAAVAAAEQIAVEEAALA